MTMWMIAVYKPPPNIQIILQRTERHPVSVLSLITFLPKGIRTNPVNLKHCKPQGIPTIVIHNNIPPKKYPNAANNPPKSNQIILPKKFMYDL